MGALQVSVGLRKVLGYGAFATLAFAVSLYATFPTQAVGQRLSYELRKATDGAWTVQFADFSLHRLTGVEARGVVFKHRDEEVPQVVEVDVLRARLQLLPLLLGGVSVHSEVEVAAGTIGLQASRARSGGVALEIVVEGVDLAASPITSFTGGVALGGVLEGTASGSWGGRIADAVGDATIKLSSAYIGPGAVAGFTVPRVEIGDVDVGVVMKAGRVEIGRFEQRGGDVVARLSGSTALRGGMRISTVDACVAFKPEPAFLGKNPKVRTALDLAAVSLRKGSDGFFNVPLAGTLAGLRVRGGLCRGR